MSNDLYSPSNYNYRYIVKPSGIIFDKIFKKFISISYTSRSEDYPIVRLNSKDGTPRNLVLHRLLATYFIENPDNKPYVNHIDGDKSNFELSNLEWVTSSENTIAAFETGLMDNMKLSKELQKRNHKLTEQQAIKVINLIMDGVDNDTIGKEFNLHPRYVSCIRGKSKWKHLWNKLYPGISALRSNKIPELKIDNTMSKLYNTDEQVEIIESLRFTTNKTISGIVKLDPSVISRVRFGKAWFEAAKKHKEKYLFPIAMCPIYNLELSSYKLNYNNKEEMKDAIVVFINSIFSNINLKDQLAIKMLNVYIAEWCMLDEGITLVRENQNLKNSVVKLVNIFKSRYLGNRVTV